ncbi:MAG: hypothetical protein U0531_12335 [Dehalococcoidia bacterium]
MLTTDGTTSWRCWQDAGKERSVSTHRTSTRTAREATGCEERHRLDGFAVVQDYEQERDGA